jgi:hypothetical protein
MSEMHAARCIVDVMAGLVYLHLHHICHRVRQAGLTYTTYNSHLSFAETGRWASVSWLICVGIYVLVTNAETLLRLSLLCVCSMLCPPSGSEARGKIHTVMILAPVSIHGRRGANGDSMLCYLSAQNVLLDSRGRCKIADFGVAHYFEEEEAKVRRHTLLTHSTRHLWRIV